MSVGTKGKYKGVCNLSNCKTGKEARWLNYGNKLFYCKSCAMKLNADPFNQRDAMRMFGHNLCVPFNETNKDG